LSLFVALAGSNNLGKGLLTYNWGENFLENNIYNIAFFLSSQVEWFGGSVLVSSIDRKKINTTRIFVGLWSIVFSLIILVVLISPV
jgi:hypothetical protein